MSLWSGTWASKEYVNIHGDVAVLLPTDMADRTTFDVPAALHYRPFTFYRPGATIDLALEGRIAQSQRVAGDNQSQPLHAPWPRLWIFSKDAGPTDQIIHYEADLEKDAEVIEGTYESSNPADRGTFRVHRKSAR